MDVITLDRSVGRVRMRSYIARIAPRASAAFSPRRVDSSRTLPRGARRVDCRAGRLGEATKEDLVQVGVIGGTHGVRGELRVQPTSDFAAERLEVPGIKWIQSPPRGLAKMRDAVPRQLESLGGRPHVHKGHSLWILKFKEINSQEDAQKLNGFRMMVLSGERHTLPQDEYYIQQLVGLKVIQRDTQEMIGIVESIHLGNGAPDILIIQRPERSEKKRVLLPFVSQFVPEMPNMNAKKRGPVESNGQKIWRICEMARSDVIRKFLRAGAHIGKSASSETAFRRDFLLDVEHVARSRYETLFAIRECFRRKQPFCVIEEDKKDAILSKKVANIILAYKTIKVRP